MFCVGARSTIIRRTLPQPTATTTNRTTGTTTMVSVLGVPCLAGIRRINSAKRARVQSPSPSCVGLLFVSPTDGCSAKCKTGPAGLVGRKVRTPRRIIFIVGETSKGSATVLKQVNERFEKRFSNSNFAILFYVTRQGRWIF